MKRIGVFSDFHTGHKVGLTPPDYFSGGRKIANRLAERWGWFEQSLKDHGPFDAAIIMGDTVDGPGVKSGQETILSLNQQVNAAADIISRIKADKIFMVYGTPVHTQTRGTGFELEKAVADILGVEIHGQIWIDAEGFILDCRHHPAGNSQVYPGNPLVKERESNLRWAAEGVQPKADIIIRGHTHRQYCVCEPNRWMGIACGALQDFGTVYGRRLSNIVNMSWGTLDIVEGMWPIWTVYEAPRIAEQVLHL